MPEHTVRRTLKRDVLPYLISGRRLRKQWFYFVHAVFGYATDFIVVLTAIGVSTPLLSLIGLLSDAKQELVPSPSLASVLSSITGWLVYPAAVAVFVWIILRVAFNREEGQKRAVLAKSCYQELRQAEASLHSILSKPEPMGELTNLLEKKIRPTVDRNIQENAWPWIPFAPDIDNEITKDLDMLCSRYESEWVLIESPELRQTK